MSIESMKRDFTEQQRAWVLERSRGFSNATIDAGANEEANFSRHVEDVSRAFRLEFGEDPPTLALVVTLAVGRVSGPRVKP
jgi:hypothetical protein